MATAATTKTVAVFGSTGGTGKAFVEQALEAGFRVKTLVRNPDGLKHLADHPNLSVMTGDVKNHEDCRGSLEGATNAVVSLGGRIKNDTICSEAQLVINRALNEVDSTMRLVVVTSMGVGDSYHDVSWGTRRFCDWIIPNAIKDKNRQERFVIRDTVNWVLVRPAGLGDGPVTGKEEFGPHAAPAASKVIPRADVAHFVLHHCLSGNDSWKRYPVSVYPPQK